jgi:hypothetical protein
MSGFEKIELSSSPAKIISESPNKSTLDQNSSNKKKRLRLGRLKSRKVAVVFVGFIVALLLLILVPSILVYSSAMKTYAQVKVTMAALKTQNIELTETELKKTRENLEDTQSKMNMLFVLKFIPGPNIYYNDAQHLLKAGIHGLDAADVFIASIKPYADVLGLKGEGSFVDGSAENRIQTAVATLDKVTPKIDDIAQDLKMAQQEISNVDPDHYPRFLAGGKVHEGMVTLTTLSKDGVEFVDQARPLIKVLPELAGQPEEKRYLLIFQNDKELRPTGGFITAYAIFKVDKGIITVESSEDIYKLDNSISNKDDAPEPILKYLPKVNVLHLRDSNLSPDFQESMETFREIYDTAPGAVDVDGIIALDTNALVAAMNVLGDVQVGDRTFTTVIDERCDCPQVIYELTAEAGTRTQYIREDRKSIIGDLMFAIMNKAFSSSPGQYWGPLVQSMFGQIAQKHIIFSLENEDAQKGLSAVNAAGEIRPFEGDYFHLNEANFGGSKSNLFVDQNVAQEYQIADDGSISKKVIVSYKNPFEPSNCNLELEFALCLNAPWRNWFRVYVPEGSKLTDSKGSEVKMSTYDEMGKTVFEGFLTVRPLGVAKLELDYTLPFKVEKGSPLPVLIQKQPGTAEDEYTISVNGKERDKFILDTDKTLNLDL